MVVSNVVSLGMNFPAFVSSRKHIPEVFHHLMLEDNSPIIDFYPKEFEIDMNGQTAVWKGIALLPFIDEVRLLEAMRPMLPKLSKEEAHRNTWGSGTLHTSEHHSMYHFLCGLYTKRKRLEVCSLHLQGLSDADVQVPSFRPCLWIPSPAIAWPARSSPTLFRSPVRHTHRHFTSWASKTSRTIGPSASYTTSPSRRLHTDLSFFPGWCPHPRCSQQPITAL